MTLYTDDYATDPIAAARVVVNGGTWAGAGGKLAQTNTGLAQFFAFQASFPRIDGSVYFDASFDITLVSDPSGRRHFGFFIQGADGTAATGYRLTHLDNVWAFSVWGGSAILDITHTTPLNVGSTYNMRVVRTGDRWQFFLDGVIQGTWHHSQYALIRPGVHNYGCSTNTDNMRMANSLADGGAIPPQAIVAITEDYTTSPFTANKIHVVSGTWVHANSALEQTNTSQSPMYAFHKNLGYARTGYVDVSVDVTLVSDPSGRKHLGFFLQTGTSDGDLSGLRIVSLDNFWYVSRYVGGSETALVNVAHTGWTVGEMKTLRVLIENGTGTLYVNGTQATTWDNKTSGQNLRPGFFTYGCSARFDNLAFANGIVAAPEPPVTQVTGVTVDALNAGFKAVWSSNVEATNGYEYRIDGGTPVAAPLTSVLVLSGVTNDVSHTIEVRSINAQGSGPWSTVVSFTPDSTLLYWDDFERPASATSPGAPVQGPAYVAERGVWGIADGTSLYSPSGTDPRVLLVDLGTVNVDIEQEMGAAAGLDQGWVFRWTSNDAYWMVTTTFNSVNLARQISAGVTMNVGPVARTWVSGDRLRIRAVEKTIQVFVNDVQYIVAEDSWYDPLLTKVGFRVSQSATPRFLKGLANSVAVESVPGVIPSDDLLESAAPSTTSFVYKGRNTKTEDTGSVA